MSTADAADICARPQSAIADAYLGARKSLRKFVLRSGANPGDIEDVVQEALACALKAEGERAIANPRAYLFRVAQNIAARQAVLRRRGLFEDAGDLSPDDVAADAPSVEDQVISRERLALLMRAVSELPPVCRQVFMMRKVYGYSQEEIAERLGVSVGTVEKHLTKGFSRCVQYMRAADGGQAAPYAIAAE